jgi:tetratricopeptide (TPR) repeat protein
MSPQRLSLVATVAFLLSTPAAHADTEGAVSVLSSGAARSCYVDANFGTASLQSIATCSDALADGTLPADDRAATFINRGILKDRLSNYSGALGDYNAGLEIRPDLVDAYVDRGALAIQLGHYAEAIADLTKAITLGTRSPEAAYYDRGLVRERSGDASGACADFRQALDLQPNFIPARQSVDICRYEKKDKPN